MAGILERRQSMHRNLRGQEKLNDNLRIQIDQVQPLVNLGLVSAMIAHEINNILTPLGNYAQLSLNHPEDMELAKKANLKTLYNLGASLTDLRRIFALQGFLLCFFGLIVGLTLAIILVILQKTYGLFMITPSLAFPVEFKTTNVIVVFFTILVLGFIAAKIASSRITKQVVEGPS